jgi:hypothetical protein
MAFQWTCFLKIIITEEVAWDINNFEMWWQRVNKLLANCKIDRIHTRQRHVMKALLS